MKGSSLYEKVNMIMNILSIVSLSVKSLYDIEWKEIL